jgi:hypothetical protein
MAITLEQAQAVQSVYINRKYFYKEQSDKYMIQFHLGNITREEWQVKRQEVKDMLPYPEGVDKEEALQMIRDEGWVE